MNLHRPGDGTDGAGTDAERAQSGFGAFPEEWVRGQSKIVVRGEVDDWTTVNRCACALLVVEDAQRTEKTLLL
jgi:hypothetical protein